MTDCIEATQKPGPNGYVYLTVAGAKVYAHRHAYTKAKGPIPEGLVVRHTCDNRRCINPNHLIVGTNKDNTGDMMERGRHRPGHVPGEANGRSVVTAAQVAELRANYIKGHPEYGGAAFARRFGISVVQANKIANGKAWAT